MHRTHILATRLLSRLERHISIPVSAFLWDFVARIAKVNNRMATIRYGLIAYWRDQTVEPDSLPAWPLKTPSVERSSEVELPDSIIFWHPAFELLMQVWRQNQSKTKGKQKPRTLRRKTAYTIQQDPYVT